MFPAAPFIYPILDLGLIGTQAPAHVARLFVDEGVKILQVRGKLATDALLVGAVREVLELTRPRQVALVVNDRPDVALIAGADGVHVGQDDLRPADVRALVGPSLIVGVSTHDLDQLQSADREPVDYVAFGPIFPTSTKQAAEPVVGLELLARARAVTRRPLVAIGGITAQHAPAVLEAGADGLAVAGAISGPDRADALASFLALVQRRG